MRKLALVLALALGGCATAGAPLPTTPAPSGGILAGTSIQAQAREIQAQVRVGCQFVPTIASIVAIINAGAGAAFGVAGEICNAVTSVPLADGGRRMVVVRGVPVRGKRVR